MIESRSITRTTLVLAAALAVGMQGLLAQQVTPVAIDGKLDETFWRTLPAQKLSPTEEGVPGNMGGEVRAVVAGKYLYLGATLPEPSGRVVARSVGVNPVWEGGGESREIIDPRRMTYGAPEGEDFVRFVIRNYNENDWMLQVGPLGAYTVSWRWTGEREWYTSDPQKCDRFLVASHVGKTEWQVEMAIPLDQLGSPRPGYLRLEVGRNRAARQGTPDEWWRWPEHEASAEVATLPSADVIPDPVFKPGLVGNTETPVEVGHRSSLPALNSGWTDSDWKGVPSWTLQRNEPQARLPEFPTEVKLIHDGRTLAILARCIEPGNVIARAHERDGSVDRDDSFQVYLATSGSTYVQYAVNPSGYVLDAAGHQGSPRLSEPHSEWNSPVRAAAWKDQGAWTARLDLPLDAVRQALGASPGSSGLKILLLRFRPGREGEPEETSVLPVTQSVTALCPARYRRLELASVDPAQLPKMAVKERLGDLAFFPTRVFSSEERKQMKLDEMLDSYLHDRVLKILEDEKRNWDRVKTVDDWQRFRDPRLQVFRSALGKFPPRCPLETRVTSEFKGDGYRRENIIYQSQPGFWVTANLYLPAVANRPGPGIVILHSLHAPKTQFELQDMGIIWARAGCAVLVMDEVGYGDRIETYPWDRDNYNYRYIAGEQLYLAGTSLTTWMMWDTMRGIDLLCDRPEVNQKEIILMGAVAGGGDPAAETAALDSRVAAVVPFNFGEAMPETARFISYKNLWPLDLAEPNPGDWDTSRVVRRSVVDQFLQWFLCASVAPRRFVYSYELGWSVEDLPAWARYQKIYGLYNAPGNLADAHGFGPFPGPGEAWNIGPAQRRSLYPTLERWFGIPVPYGDSASHSYENLAPRPEVDRRPADELSVLTPAVAAEIHNRSVHDLAREQGMTHVEAARRELAKLSNDERVKWLQSKWAAKLGDIEPNRHPQATIKWTKLAPGARAVAMALAVEPGVTVPMLLLEPSSAHGQRAPAVVAVAEGGKDLFLAQRSSEIESLLKVGIAVCLPDLRATGETSADFRRDPDSTESIHANTVLTLGDTLVGLRLKDLRTVVAYLGSLEEIDAQRIGLWGDSLAPANPADLILNEVPQWQIGPQIEQQAEPLGGLVALLAALYEPSIHAVSVNGGLVSFASALDDTFTYIPQDVIIPGILDAGDLADVEAALAPRALRLAGLVDGLDRLVPETVLKQQLGPAEDAYQNEPLATLTITSEESGMGYADWFLKHL
jgi:cephalosporin-C deacetylase-like acetyl esterase